MKIAQIAPPWIAIPPKNYGGTESVLSTLVEEQVAQGHEVTLFAPGDARHLLGSSHFSRPLCFRKESPGACISKPFITCKRLWNR